FSTIGARPGRISTPSSATSSFTRSATISASATTTWSGSSARRDGARSVAARFLEHLARGAEGVDGGGNAGIDGGVEKNLADLLARDAIGQRAPHMELQLMRLVERRQHGEVEHAARLPRKARPPPHRAPAIFGDEFLQRPIEIVGALD